MLKEEYPQNLGGKLPLVQLVGNQIMYIFGEKSEFNTT